MTAADQILVLLQHETQGLSDGALSRRLDMNHVYVNQVCRRLADQGLIIRDGATRPLLNRLSDSPGRLVVRPPASPLPLSVDVVANARAYLGDRNPESRYSSFDYCFNYFRSFYERNARAELASDENLEQSSIQLAFYLASWGMFRGKADLLQRSARYFSRLVHAVVDQPAELWEVDVDSYDNDTISLILASSRSLSGAFLGSASDTLITKLMLGVYGCVPAFDRYFKAGLGATTLGSKSLRRIRAIYDENADAIQSQRVTTLDFTTGKPTSRRYTSAKVIDMVFFVEGYKSSDGAPGRSRPYAVERG